MRYGITNWLISESFTQLTVCGTVCMMLECRRRHCSFQKVSNGVINNGCIRAIDGWVVKIWKLPKKGNVFDSQSIYSQKEYYAVKVQAIIDKKKRILFCGIMSCGAKHNLSAFEKLSLLVD